MERLRRYTRLILISIVVVAITGEILLRLLAFFSDYSPRPRATFLNANAYLRSALVPNARFRYGSYRVDVNHFGFRGEELSMPKPAGTFRIFALGESSTFGWKGITTHTEAWPALLERKLQEAYPGRIIEVINAGVPGYTSVEQRVNFMLRISKLQPDAILIYHGNNDINWSWVPDLETRLIYGRDAGERSDSWWARVVDRSYLLMELRTYIEAGAITGRIKHNNPDPAALHMLDNNLRALIGDARRIGVRVAIGTFAHALDVNGKTGIYSEDEITLAVPQIANWFDNLSPQGARRTFPLYNTNIRKLATSYELPLADLAAAIPPTPEFHIDWCHLTAKGHERAAEIWLKTLQRSGWFADPQTLSSEQGIDERRYR